MLTVANLTKRFGSHVANDNVSISVRPGIIFGLLGPNGAGKTTLIRMITQIIEPDQGTITLSGISDSERNQRIGYLPEERGLYKKLSVIDQLIYFASLKGLSHAEARMRAMHWLERMDARGWESKKIQELSKGMQQKVQFIATVIHQPSLLILDEPFSGLDPVNADLLINVIREIQSNGTTIVLSTHQMDQVERLCDDIALIHKGRVVLNGTLAAIRSANATNRLRFAVQGQPDVLTDIPGTEVFARGNDWIELSCAHGVQSNRIVQEALTRAMLLRFNIVEPTLNEIFIRTVTDPTIESQVPV
ncbi:MAG: ATP-binding cassette domain-containing protein [Ignavibacteria bacterium]|nr:ATP-binding cassette domain-containing protein [Ignavibacteria bacterium]